MGCLTRHFDRYVLVFTLFLLLIFIHVEGDEERPLPDVSACRTCMRCKLDGKVPDHTIEPEDLEARNFMPTDDDVKRKQEMPDCEECSGCTTELTVLVKSGTKQIFGRWGVRNFLSCAMDIFITMAMSILRKDQTDAVLRCFDASSCCNLVSWPFHMV